MSAVGEIAHSLAGHGLMVRGGFAFAPGETVPKGAAGARAVLLVGHAGRAMWPHFMSWRSQLHEDIADPLDTWSRLVIGRVAERFAARAVSPSDRPYLPFQQWAMRAEGLRPSPLGILMHPEFGLWHAYRGALLFDAVPNGLAEPAVPPVHLCDACIGRPCLTACPVNAYAESGFAYSACLGHVRSTTGQRCMTAGCLDRNACPHGAPYRYDAQQQAFHMRAFAARASA